MMLHLFSLQKDCRIRPLTVSSVFFIVRLVVQESRSAVVKQELKYISTVTINIVQKPGRFMKFSLYF